MKTARTKGWHKDWRIDANNDLLVSHACGLIARIEIDHSGNVFARPLNANLLENSAGNVQSAIIRNRLQLLMHEAVDFYKYKKRIK